jgi:probable HAF family extracellular repeat protein
MKANIRSEIRNERTQKENMKINVRSEIRNEPTQKNNQLNERNYQMKTTTYLTALAACLAIGVSSAGAQMYSLTDLGYLPNKKENVSTAAAINDSGYVAGTSGGAAFRYTKEMEEIGQDPDGLSRGFGIDGSGQVVGDSTFKGGSISHAALFSNGSVRDLGTLKGSGPFSRANGINVFGQVVGFSSEKFDSNDASAFIMNTSGDRLGRMLDLGTLGGQSAQAWGINDSGFVTGNSQTTSDIGATHAFLWQKGARMLDLGTLAGDFSYGTFINANNHVVGYSTIDKENGRVHAFLHDGKEMLDLGSLGGASMQSDRSFALGVNVHDQVVGYSYLPLNWGDIFTPPLQQVAFLYCKGVMENLNDLIGDAAKEYRLDSATAINDKGQIVAIAFVNSADAYHAVLLTPGFNASTGELDRGGAKLAITSATYSVKYAVLTVQATYALGAPSTMLPGLSVYESATDSLLGTLQTKDGSSYFGSFSAKANPLKIWVADNNGNRVDAEVRETK